MTKKEFTTGGSLIKGKSRFLFASNNRLCLKFSFNATNTRGTFNLFSILQLSLHKKFSYITYYVFFFIITVSEIRNKY